VTLPSLVFCGMEFSRFIQYGAIQFFFYLIMMPIKLAHPMIPDCSQHTPTPSYPLRRFVVLTCSVLNARTPTRIWRLIELRPAWFGLGRAVCQRPIFQRDPCFLTNPYKSLLFFQLPFYTYTTIILPTLLTRTSRYNIMSPANNVFKSIRKRRFTFRSV